MLNLLLRSVVQRTSIWTLAWNGPMHCCTLYCPCPGNILCLLTFECKVVSAYLGKPVRHIGCTQSLSHRSFPSLAFQTVPVLVWWWPCLVLQGRSSNASSLCASLLQVIDSLCPWLHSSSVALRPQKPLGLLGTRSSGRPPRLARSFWALTWGPWLCTSRLYWVVQWSWFARVNALCNLSRKKSREVAASLPGRFLSRRCFTFFITMEVEFRIAKQYKCHHCCSCKNYQGKGWKVEKSVCVIFWLTRRSRVRGKIAFWGILLGDSGGVVNSLDFCPASL